MSSRRLIVRLVPYVAAFGLLGSTLAWQEIAARQVNENISAAPEVAVDEQAVPVVRSDTPVESAPPQAGPTTSAPAQGGAEAEADGSTPEPSAATPVVIAELTPREVDPFTMVGVTWASGVPASAVIDVRWRGKAGWSAWTELHQDLVPVDDGPGRPGTEPQWVDWADAVHVRVTSPERAVPVDLQLALINPGDGVAMAPAAVAQPAIIARATWGARGAGSCSSPVYGPATQGAVIHHTVGKNDYAQAESPGIVRSVQAYHMNSRNWCDIGYNFLVDRFGQIFEGRGGGIDRPVRAAHSGNAAVNEQTVGVSLMGTFTSADATPAMKDAVARLVAWRFGLAGIPAKGGVAIGGKQLNRIAGHRDVVSTACPGQLIVNWLGAPGGLRDRVEQLLAGAPATPAPAPAPTTAPPSPAPAVQPTTPAPTPPPPPAPVPVVAPQPAALTVPDDLRPSKRRSRSISFRWKAVPGAVYEIRVSREKSMSYPRVERSTDATEKVNLRASNQRYYAQVRALKPDGSGATGWSDKVQTSTTR